MRGRFCLLLALLYPAISRSANSSTIVGSVSDAWDWPVAGASVTLVHAETNAQRQALTDRRGRFTFVGLAHGTYYVTIRCAGYVEQRGLEALLAEETREVDYQLFPAGVDSITISPATNWRHGVRPVPRWLTQLAITLLFAAIILAVTIIALSQAQGAAEGNGKRWDFIIGSTRVLFSLCLLPLFAAAILAVLYSWSAVVARALRVGASRPSRRRRPRLLFMVLYLVVAVLDQTAWFLVTNSIAATLVFASCGLLGAWYGCWWHRQIREKQREGPRA